MPNGIAVMEYEGCARRASRSGPGMAEDQEPEFRATVIY